MTTFKHKLAVRIALLFSVGLWAVGCNDSPMSAPATTGGEGITAATTATFVIGARVQSQAANIRSGPSISATLLGQQPTGALGTIIGGPVVDATGDGLTRWQVDFDSGVDGWAAQNYLTLVSAPTPAAVASVTVTPNPASVAVGGTLQLVATLKDSAGNVLTGRTISWSSSSSASATVNGSGLVAGVAAGSATITATSEGKSGTTSLTVSVVPVASVAVSPATASVNVAASVQLAATAKDASGNTLTGRIITWSSSNTASATVSGSGLVTGIAAGSATITATSEGKSGTSNITVTAPPPPPPATFAIGARVKSLAANIRSGPSVSATLLGQQPNGALGTIIGGPITDVSGDGLIRWQVDFDAGVDGWAAQNYLSVVTPPSTASVFSVTVTPNPASASVGGTVQLAATLKDSAGNILTGRTISWSSSSTSIATVSGSGLVTGIVAGSVMITATSGGKSGTTSLTVVAPPPPPPPGSSQFGHVFIITLENTNYSSVIGSSSMPYLNGLANQYGLATQYYAVTHPSIGNYFELATGQIITNNDSYSTIVTVDNIVRRLLAAGKTWKSYAEDLPSVGYIGGDVGNYARKHNVLALLSDVANDATQRNNLVPFTQFQTDLANGALPAFSNIVPNLCNDGHDCGLSTADTWLKNNIAPLIASATFQQDGLLIITFDESGSDNTNGGGRVVWIAISPKSSLAYKSTSLYQHQSTLRLMLKGLGVTSYPGAAASAPDMGEFFNP